MKNFLLLYLFFFLSFEILSAQTIKDYTTVKDFRIDSLPSSKISKFWLYVGEDAFNQPIRIPIIVFKGNVTGPILGLTAAIHGNELNGIAIIHKLLDYIDVSKLKGTIIAIPGLNPLAIQNEQREYVDLEDLNRIFPGDSLGNRSEQLVHYIETKLISKFQYHIDMHTASFGRENTMYIRADVKNDMLLTMAELQFPDIILNNKGTPSFGSSESMTMRASALKKEIHSITVEYGNPQVYQPEMIERGTKGVANLLIWLKMLEGQLNTPSENIICSKSYWIYSDRGGMLEVPVKLNETIIKGQIIGILRNPLGDIIKKFKAPEDGIVVGRSTNPVNISGGRIIHLGILMDDHN